MIDENGTWGSQMLIAVFDCLIYKKKEMELPFEICKIISKGSSGTVYLATVGGNGKGSEHYEEEEMKVDVDSAFMIKKKNVDADQRLLPVGDKQVAVKVMEKWRVEKDAVMKEVEILKSLFAVSPFVIPFKFYHETKSYMMIGLEYASGGDLFQLLCYEALTCSDILFYTCEMMVGIRHLHKANIIHTDLKPENIALSKTGHVRIVDFGLAQVMTVKNYDDDLGKMMTITRSGTLPYSCPEVLCGRPHGFEADWWSFAVIVYEMLFLSLPWFGADDQETCNLICSTPCIARKALNDQEECLFHFICSILRKNSNERLGSKNGFLEMIKHELFADVAWEAVLSQTFTAPFVLDEHCTE